MKPQEIKTAENADTINAVGIEINDPMHKNSPVKTYEAKPTAFPHDSRGFWEAEG